MLATDKISLTWVKTAVIIALADGVKLMRVTVLSSLRATNAAGWQLKLGGSVARFIRRDLAIGTSRSRNWEERSGSYIIEDAWSVAINGWCSHHILGLSCAHACAQIDIHAP